ncbi:MAG: TetR/AcrR family transcriptional regulator [Clostridia bacterium]|nr:TetR/AcrR family transcriptional regulator [Clostridia bacterium]
MNKNESKYFNTAIKMNEALISLLEKKDFEYITVTEICKAAGVNRSTFYLHYENTSDLLKETTRYITDKHLKYYSAELSGISLCYEDLERKRPVFISSQYLTPYLTFIKDNQKLFRVSIKRLESMNFESVYGSMFTNIFNPILAQFDISESKRAYIMKFYLTGITAIVMEWLNNNCSDDINEIIEIITDCILGERSIEE